MDCIEQPRFLLRKVHTNELFVESNGQRRLFAEECHLFPLVLFDRLFNGMNVVSSELIQPLHSILRSEPAIGIHTQFNLFFGEMLADMPHELELA